MDISTLRDILTRIQTNAAGVQADVTAALALVPLPYTLVKAGENLQAALDKGGEIRLEAGAVFEGGYVLSVPGTRLLGNAASVHCTNKLVPALGFAPGAHDIYVELMEATTQWDQACVQVGHSDWADINMLPRNIVLSGIKVPTHRGKRAFELNCGNTTLLSCSAFDVYDYAASTRDSQGILILNAIGDIHVSGGHFQSGSENILIGGDRTGVVGITPTNILVEDVILEKPLAWMTDGVNRAVKNLFEVKSGVNITLRRAQLDGNWVAAQAGHAIVLTPRNNKKVANILVEDVTVRNAGNAFNFLPANDTTPSATMENVTIRRVDAVTQSGKFGDGRFMLMPFGIRNGVVVENCKWDGPNSVVYAYKGKTWPGGDTAVSDQVWPANLVSIPETTTLGFRFVNNDMSLRSYGITTPAGAYSINWKLAFPDGVIEGNTFRNMPNHESQKNLPANNTFIYPAVANTTPNTAPTV
jgi:hypothetical protein